jgi:hypothetical protein
MIKNLRLKIFSPMLIVLGSFLYWGCGSSDDDVSASQAITSTDYSFIEDRYLGVFVDGYLQGEQDSLRKEIFADILEVTREEARLFLIQEPVSEAEMSSVKANFDSITAEVDEEAINTRVTEVNALLVVEYDSDNDGLLNAVELQSAITDRKEKRAHTKKALKYSKDDVDKVLSLDEFKVQLKAEDKRFKTELSDLKEEFGDITNDKALLKKAAVARKERRNGDYTDFMAHFDTDKDDLLSQEEINSGYKKHADEKKEEELNWLAKFDTDGDGELSDEERKDLLAHKDKERKRIEKQKTHYDSDGNGKLSKAERAEHMKFEANRREHKKDFIYSSFSEKKPSKEERKSGIENFEKKEEEQIKFIEKFYSDRKEIHELIKEGYENISQDRENFLEDGAELTTDKRKDFFNNDYNVSFDKEIKEWEKIVSNDNSGENKEKFDFFIKATRESRGKFEGKKGKERRELKEEYLKTE